MKILHGLYRNTIKTFVTADCLLWKLDKYQVRYIFNVSKIKKKKLMYQILYILLL